MDDALLERLDVARYQRLMDRMAGRNCPLWLLNSVGKIVSGPRSPADGGISRRVLDAPDAVAAGVHRLALDAGRTLLFRPLTLGPAGLAGWAALIADGGAGAADSDGRAHAPVDLDGMAAALEDVASGLCGEAALHYDMDRMAVELGECYEDLHLMFGMGAHVKAHAWEEPEVLRGLLQSTAEQLRADVAAFVRPAADICVHAASPGNEIRNLDAALAEMRGNLFRLVQSAGDTVVINDADDPNRPKAFRDLPCRVLASPVRIERRVVGMFVLLTPLYKPPFSNADRRLLDVLANQMSSLGEMIGSIRKKDAIQATFGKYVDPRIVKSLVEDSRFASVGERRPMSVLFSDLEGFTGLCEQITPDAAVKFLNSYFNRVSEPIVAKQGIIDKYMGDAVMAFWGPPFTDPADHARLACEAALEQLAGLTEFRKSVPDILGENKDKGLPRVNMRTGVSTGEVTVGNVGSDRLKGYTVIGDTVNLAARLETACKQYGVHIIISEETRANARAAIETRELDRIRVVGKSQPVNVFELMGAFGDIPPASHELRDAFEAALIPYRSGDIARARSLFEQCQRIAPEDQPTRVFLTRCKALGGRSVPDSWDGVWTLSFK